LRLIDYSDEKAMLILQSVPGGTMREFLRTKLKEAQPRRRLMWATQMAEAVQTLHSCSVIHCDIKPESFLLDEQLQAYLIDFAGSAIDNKAALIMENERFRLPCDDFMASQAVANIKTDMFALGSSIFEIITSKQPYENLEDDEVVKRFADGVFADINEVFCGDLVLKCWRGEFDSVGDVHKALAGRKILE
jgi:serine/threonine protein kinase